MRYVLSLAPNDVKKYLSVAVQICMALGITRAVRSLVIALISEHLMVNYNRAKIPHSRGGVKGTLKLLTHQEKCNVTKDRK